MKKGISILFLFCYLITFTEVSQLLKLSVMIEHFNESKQHSSKLTFLDFIEQHYLYDDGDRGDNDKDSQLPFKSNHSLSFAGINCPPDISTSLHLVQKENETLEFFLYKENLNSSYLSAIWHPPKTS